MVSDDRKLERKLTRHHEKKFKSYWKEVLESHSSPTVGTGKEHESFATKITDEQGSISEHRARIVVCGTEEAGFSKGRHFQGGAHFFMKQMLRLYTPQMWKMRHSNFGNALPSGSLERLVYAGLPKNLFHALDKTSGDKAWEIALWAERCCGNLENINALNNNQIWI